MLGDVEPWGKLSGGCSEEVIDARHLKAVFGTLDALQRLSKGAPDFTRPDLRRGVDTNGGYNREEGAGTGMY